MDTMFNGVSEYRGGFHPAAHPASAAWAVAAFAIQRKRGTAANDPSVDRGLLS